MTVSDPASGDEQDPSPGVEAFGEVPMDPVQQRVDGLLPMICHSAPANDVVVEDHMDRLGRA